MTEYVVTFGTEYRATLGICSIIEARRYHEHARRVSAWFEKKTGQRLEDSTGDAWTQLPEDIRANTDMALSMGEILASVRVFEVGEAKTTPPTMGDDEQLVKYSGVVWTVAEFPDEWRNPDTFAHQVPAQFYDDLLTAARRLNGGLFVTSPFFGLRSNIAIK
ncbi:MAG: hypothetical protein KDD89_05375 [Anaerolineales bacterium]|nr:hypothetical protein [Anaerolineales bacterium]